MIRESNKDKTGVFWNIDHCPIPGGLSPRQINEFIKGALQKDGYLGDVSIMVYSDMPIELRGDYNDAGIILQNSVGEGVEKLHEMSTDIFLFGLDNGAPSNVFVISKDIAEDTLLFDVLKRMYSMEYIILVAQPENVDSEEPRHITSTI